jgi:hypothetical protein
VFYDLITFSLKYIAFYNMTCSYRVGEHSDNSLSLVFGTCLVWISAGSPLILTEVLIVFPGFSRHISRHFLEIGYYHFLPYPSNSPVFHQFMLSSDIGLLVALSWYLSGGTEENAWNPIQENQCSGRDSKEHIFWLQVWSVTAPLTCSTALVSFKYKHLGEAPLSVLYERKNKHRVSWELYCTEGWLLFRTESSAALFY